MAQQDAQLAKLRGVDHVREDRDGAVEAFAGGAPPHDREPWRDEGAVLHLAYAPLAPFLAKVDRRAPQHEVPSPEGHASTCGETRRADPRDRGHLQQRDERKKANERNSRAPGEENENARAR